MNVSRGQQVRYDRRMDELAIACSLSPEELQERGTDLLPGLLELPMVSGH